MAKSIPRARRLHNNLTVQVLTAIFLGVMLGIFAPATARAMKPIGDTFVNLVKMVIGPVIFLTIVLGISSMHDLKKVGRVGGKAFIYFEIVTTFALAIGLVVAATLVIARSEGAFDDAQRERAVTELHVERLAGAA